jgi:cell division protein FtsI (penicillin-binding protein 3)
MTPRKVWSAEPSEHPRLMFVAAILVSWALALAFRLYTLQVETHDHYQAKAFDQQQKVVVLDAPRGAILDAKGRELAISVEVVSIGAFPRKIDDKKQASSSIANVLGITTKERNELRQRLESSKNFVWVKRKIEPALAEKLRALNLKGLEFLEESKRSYPMHELAAQVLGYVGTDNKGLAGLEFFYEREVAAEQGQRTVLRDGLHATMVDPNLHRRAPRPGKDLHLTIDATLQQIVERELAAGVIEQNAKRGMAVMLEPATGAILAMASYPTFDPNAFGKADRETWRNLPVMDAFEPGSTFKMVTLAAALEAHEVDLIDSFNCGNGSITLFGTRINDHKSFAVLTVQDIIAKSSNIGAIHLGRAAGNERFFATIESFGFGRVTGIDLPNESPGLLRPLEKWSAITPAYVSFGQGMSLTALQLANAFNAVANGGRLLRPYVVQAIGDKPRRARPDVLGLPISPASLRQVRAALEAVVVEGGTAKPANVEIYGAAGKTGTAQKAGKGGYLANRYIASFVGYAPKAQPALVMAIVLDEPWPRYHGGDAAAPIFGRIAAQALLSMGIKPERDDQELWPGQVEEPEVPPGQQLAELANDVPVDVVVPIETPPGTIPDLTGLSARQALAQASSLGLRPVFNGHGEVVNQEPVPGTPLEATAGSIELWLEGQALPKKTAMPAAPTAGMTTPQPPPADAARADLAGTTEERP